jgi:hypothetical protein
LEFKLQLVRVSDTLKHELQPIPNMPLPTELENVLGCDFYKYIAPDGAIFGSLHRPTQQQPM